MRVGGPATQLVTADNVEAIIDAVRAADEAAEPLLVLSGGSNLVVADGGFEGTVVRIASRGVQIESASACAGATLRVAAGEPWDNVVAQAVEQGWSGIEALSGIPGAVGATPVQNVGAYGQEVAQTIAQVRTWDRAQGRVRTFAAADCQFSYRTSRFKSSFSSLRSARTASPSGTPTWLVSSGCRSGTECRCRLPGRVCSPSVGSAGWSWTTPTTTPGAVARSSPIQCSIAQTSQRWRIGRAGGSDLARRLLRFRATEIASRRALPGSSNALVSARASGCPVRLPCRPNTASRSPTGVARRAPTSSHWPRSYGLVCRTRSACGS